MLIGYKDSIGKRSGVLAVTKTGHRVYIGPRVQSLGFAGLAKVGDTRILGANVAIILDIYHEALGKASSHQLHRRSVRVNLYSIVTMTSTQGNFTCPLPKMVKKIHYCWFGGKTPASVVANVTEWKRLNPDFEFYEWNDDNIDVAEYDFGRKAIRDKRWGFLVDIIRPLKLFTEGGFYIDADVEMIQPLNLLESEGDNLIIGYMYDCALGTAVVYSPQGHPLIGEILAEYHKVREEAWPVSNSVFTDYFINSVPGFRLNGGRWFNREQRISLYPKEFFEQPAYRKGSGMAIHHCSGSWMPENTHSNFKVTTGTSSHRSKWIRRKIRTLIALICSEYLPVYIRSKLGLGSNMKTPWKY